MKRGNKMRRFPTAFVGLLISMILVLVACGSSPVPTAVGSPTPSSPTPSPTPTLGHCNSKLLPGHLLIDEEVTGIHELTCTPTGTIQDKLIFSWEEFPATLSSQLITLSPDGRFLRYVVPSDNSESTTFTIGSQDLQTGVKHTYQLSGDKDSSSCVSWSPSGTQVSYVAQGGIIVENLNTGAKRVLLQEPSANYSIGGLPPGGPVFGDIDCGAWISDDILLFHRFIGQFPDEITYPGANKLAVNTTTLALLRDGTFVDTKGASLEISALSQDGKYVLLSGIDADGNPDGNWKLAKASDFTSFAAARPFTRGGVLLGFVPHSDEVFGYYGGYIGLVFVNPQDLTVKYGPNFQPANITISGNISHFPTHLGELEVIQWGGTPDNVIVVYEYQDTSKNQDYYAVTSIHTGEVNWLTDARTGNTLLAWIP